MNINQVITSRIIMIAHMLKNTLILIIISCFIMCMAGCGSEFNVLFDDDGPDGQGVRYRVYWSEKSGSIKRATTDGSFEEEIFTASGTPLDIDLYMPGQRIYWTEATGSDFAIMYAGLDGSGPGTFYTSSLPGLGPSAIAIDTDNAIIYWNKYHSTPVVNDIWRSSIASSVSPEKWMNDLPAPDYYIFSIGLDSDNRKIYITSNSYWDIDNLLGSGASGGMYLGEMDMADTYAEQFSATGAGDPSVPLRGIAVDAASGYVYFVNSETAPAVIRRSDLTFGSVVDWITADGFGIHKLALDARENKIYWTSPVDNSIYRADTGASESGIELFLLGDASPTGIAIAP